MTGKRKRCTAEFEARVALEALRGELTTARPATKHAIHRTMAGGWKKRALEGPMAVFSGGAEAREGAKSAETEAEGPHAETGRLVERGRSPDAVERDLSAQASGRWASSGGDR